LLASFYKTVVLPPAVVYEIEAGRMSGIDLPDVRAFAWMRIQVPSGWQNVPTSPSLGAGEREVLALGIEVPGVVIIVDDRLARVHAAALNLTFTGTLGILLRAKVEGRITQIRPLLERLTRLGFRLSANTLTAILKHAGE
jgi:hypothetical protein